MATTAHKKLIAELIRKVFEAHRLQLKLELAGVPKDCEMSAAASILALGQPRRWVWVPLDDGPAVAFDLRRGREVEQTGS